MLAKATEQPKKFKDNKDNTQYLDILLSEDGIYSVKVKSDVIATEKNIQAGC